MTALLSKVLVTRVPATEHTRLLRLHPGMHPSAILRLALAAYPPTPTCDAPEPGNWTSAHLPTCRLPTGHAPLPHWSPDPDGQARIWGEPYLRTWPWPDPPRRPAGDAPPGRSPANPQDPPTGPPPPPANPPTSAGEPR